MSQIVQEVKFLSDLLGAHDLSDFVTEVLGLSPTSPALQRGDVVCKLASGDVTLAGAELSTPVTVYGIVLDFAVDPTAPNPIASVARGGVYDATALRVDASTNLAAFADQLRVIGIFLEKLPLVQREMKSAELKSQYPELYRELMEEGHLEGVLSKKEQVISKSSKAVNLLVEMFKRRGSNGKR
jgi:hypothetical protein